jgi:hypothetical protein
LVQKHSRFLLVEKSAHLCRLFFHFDISWYFMIFHDISWYFMIFPHFSWWTSACLSII